MNKLHPTGPRTGAYHVAYVIDQIRIARWMQSDVSEGVDGISDYGHDADAYWSRQLDELNDMLSEESGYYVTAIANDCGWDFLAFEVSLPDVDDDDDMRTLRIEFAPTFGLSNVRAFEADGKTEADDDAAWDAIDALSAVLDGLYVREFGDDIPHGE